MGFVEAGFFVPFSYARFRLEEPLKCGSDFLDEICGGCGPAMLGEGLGRTGAGETGRCPTRQDARAGIRTLGLHAVAPVQEDGACT